ncbi:type IX secretion system membrane protein, PorP/SprF family [Saccharicrinis carchari]|uniref:Type IX secretion system membrane protein, PorP/SprF family n=1 Tax=Saccharicrinis carchari TaxID=1168039 RepID=A0A521BRU3_SACCC|nr:PorP/SprF family type IX secretion system membrane protein [Saccharicrinis carchari]SMO49874.1 type IX secretion system membrane protein, PorP/SprF family [Saccharicrinis carchari]
MLRKLILVFVVLSIFCAENAAQSNLAFAEYVFNPMSINPAYAGGQEALNFSLFYAQQWTGIQGSPKNMTFSADAPFMRQKLGLGLMLVNEQYGVSHENKISTNYAYRIISPKSVLSFGLGANIKLTNSTYSDLIALDPGDEMYLQDSKTYALTNFSFGMHYSRKQFFVGFSIPRLLNHSFDIDQKKYVYQNDFSKFRYLLNTGFTVWAGDRFNIVPSLLFQYTSSGTSKKMLYDANTLLCYNDFLCLGGSYQNERAFSTLFQVKPNKQISITYSFNFETSQLNTYKSGSHQIMLKYIFKYKVYAPNSLIF